MDQKTRARRVRKAQRIVARHIPKNRDLVAELIAERRAEAAAEENPSVRLKMTPQMVGAYGEKVVEAQLLRRGWIPSNVNASVKNAARFDIVAQRPGGQLVPI